MINNKRRKFSFSINDLIFMLKWNVKIQKFNTDAISLTEKWSQNTNCANLHVRFSIRRYLNTDSHTMLVSKIKEKVFPRFKWMVIWVMLRNIHTRRFNILTLTQWKTEQGRKVEIANFAIPYYFIYMIRDCIILIWLLVCLN